MKQEAVSVLEQSISQPTPKFELSTKWAVEKGCEAYTKEKIKGLKTDINEINFVSNYKRGD